jgi:hypothetical protein
VLLELGVEAADLLFGAHLLGGGDQRQEHAPEGLLVAGYHAAVQVEGEVLALERERAQPSSEGSRPAGQLGQDPRQGGSHVRREAEVEAGDGSRLVGRAEEVDGGPIHPDDEDAREAVRVGYRGPCERFTVSVPDSCVPSVPRAIPRARARLPRRMCIGGSAPGVDSGSRQAR